jgi:hypothetical protein
MLLRDWRDWSNRLDGTVRLEAPDAEVRQMGFYRSQAPKPSPGSFKGELLLAVGRRAFVNLPQSGSQRTLSAPMSDDRGRPVENDLEDGQEVEVLAWSPRSRGGLSYQIRRLSDGREWWLLAVHLRKLLVPAAPAA